MFIMPKVYHYICMNLNNNFFKVRRIRLSQKTKKFTKGCLINLNNVYIFISCSNIFTVFSYSEWFVIKTYLHYHFVYKNKKYDLKNPFLQCGDAVESCPHHFLVYIKMRGVILIKTDTHLVEFDLANAFSNNLEA